jgi:hypothetical protein
MVAIRSKQLECSNRFLVLCEENFRLAQERGFLSAKVDPRCAAIGLMAVVDGLVLKWTLDRTLFPLDRFGPLIFETYLNGLFATPH